MDTFERMLGVRWVIGDADPRTIESLERSMRAVELAFPRAAQLAVCVHSAPLAAVLAGLKAPRRCDVSWLQVDHDVPVFVRRRVDLSMAGGRAWRFAPLRVFAGCPELLLSTGCVLRREEAEAVRRWALTPGQRRCLLGWEVGRSGAAAEWDELSVRGVPASFDLEGALELTLSRGPALLLTAADAFAAETRSLSYGAPPIVLDAAEKRVDGRAFAG